MKHGIWDFFDLENKNDQKKENIPAGCVVPACFSGPPDASTGWGGLQVNKFEHDKKKSAIIIFENLGCRMPLFPRDNQEYLY